MEARVAFSSLLSGAFSPDEILVEAPTMNAGIDSEGNSQLKDIIKRFAPSNTGGDLGPVDGTRIEHRLRRIVVSHGDLRLSFGNHTSAWAQDVELSPHRGGVRIVTGQVTIHSAYDQRLLDATFVRSAFDVSMPSLAIERAVAVGGTAMFMPSAGDPPWQFRTLAVSRVNPTSPIEAFGRLEDHGASRWFRMWADTTEPLAIALKVDQFPLWPLQRWLPSSLRLKNAHLSGRFALAVRQNTVAVRGNGHVESLGIMNPQLDDAEFVVNPSFDIAMTFVGQTPLQLSTTRYPTALNIEDITLRVPPSVLHLSGNVDGQSGALKATLKATIDPVSCSAALAAIPSNIRRPLDGLGLSGDFGGSVGIDVDLSLPLGTGLKINSQLTAANCKVLSEPPLADVSVLRGTIHHTFPDGSARSVGPNADQWIDISAMPSVLHGAFTSAEDGRFYEHHGFDVEQIARSLEVNVRDGKLLRGGSTISQQLIKNSFLNQRRNFARKLQEAVLTWRLENTLTKRQILQRYLNIIELGPSVFGVVAAAQFWFGCSPAALGTKQAAFLAALTSEPKSMTRRVRQAGGVDPATAHRIDVILRAMRRDNVISDEGYLAVRDDKLTFEPAALQQP
jgi:hypothetical protein